jgi:signal peptidase I
MGKLIRGLGWILGVVVVFGIIARLTIVEAWVIPDLPRFGIALEPTLTAGDTVLMLTRGTPGFGDLVRCTDPDDANGFVVGRIAGLSGDTVEANGGDLRVDGKRYDGEMACPETTRTVIHPTSGDKVTLTCDQVQMGGRLHYRGVSQKRDIPTPVKLTVGTGMVFLLSDDRSYHDDSRDFGVVPLDSCKNRIFGRVWSKAGWSDDRSRLSYIR